MKKITIILSVLTLALSSCLKDKPNVNFSNLGTVVELVESGKAYFGQDAITSTKDTITVPIQLNIASPNPPTSDVTVGLAVDNSLITVDPAVGYIAIPTAAYKLSAASVTVKAGQRLANLTLTIYKNQLDGSKSYQLPVKIASTTLGTISGNFGVHYYHIIGNDFAGTYTHYYTRYNAADSTSATPSPKNSIQNTAEIFSPVSPTQFEVKAYYYTSPRYEVTFTKNGSGATATYTNFAVTLNVDDIAAAATASGGGVTFSSPAFAAPASGGLSPTGTYTYAQVLQRLKFINVAASSGSPRYTIDRYVHN